MGGAAITISIMALAAAHTLGISVDFPTALILCILAAASAAGASGVAGGSLLLIPMACSLFGIPNDVAMQVVGVGFIVGVIQDSCETALNSSTDVLLYCMCLQKEKNFTYIFIKKEQIFHICGHLLHWSCPVKKTHHNGKSALFYCPAQSSGYSMHPTSEKTSISHPSAQPDTRSQRLPPQSPV